MSRVFFDRELDTVASFWRVFRRDGVAHAFTTHDRDLWFDGLLYLAAPGMLPSAIRRTSSLADDGAQIAGALAHDTIREEDLESGRFDEARVVVGAVDWQTCEARILYRGTIEAVERDGAQFTAQLRSAKAVLETDPVARTSPTCRARFCDKGCTLPATAHTIRARVSAVDPDTASVTVAVLDSALYAGGELRWLDGALTGRRFAILSADGEELVLDGAIEDAEAGQRIILREGCDHTIATCAERFDNAVNFRGEPYLPGNDFLIQYPQPR